MTPAGKPTAQGQQQARYVPPRKTREKQRTATVMQPPLTPMIDVVFQLLLFFLLACQFRQEEGLIPANLPDVKNLETVTALRVLPVRINVLATGQHDLGALFKIEDTDLQWRSASGLLGYLMDLARKEDPKRVPVFIKPIGPVRWEHVVNAYNQAILAKFKKIGFESSGL